MSEVLRKVPLGQANCDCKHCHEDDVVLFHAVEYRDRPRFPWLPFWTYESIHDHWLEAFCQHCGQVYELNR